MNYVAIDFETAACRMDSACALGLVRFDSEGEILDSWYSLIRPPVLQFDDVCTQVHHLSPIEISKAPTLLDLWPEISGFIKNDPLVAHNAQFDMNFLNSECERCSLPPVKNKVSDTLKLSRLLFPDFASHKLDFLADQFMIDKGSSHRALDDAKTCMELFNICMIKANSVILKQ